MKNKRLRIPFNKNLNYLFRDLQLLSERTAKKCERLESAVKEEEVQHWHNVALILEKNKEGFQSFQDLDSHINSVATKVVHLGDQLENVNTPRSRAVEAQRLMNHFAEFLSEGPLVSEVFTDETRVSWSHVNDCLSKILLKHLKLIIE